MKTTASYCFDLEQGFKQHTISRLFVCLHPLLCNLLLLKRLTLLMSAVIVGLIA